MQQPIVTSAPGSTMLFGEHAVLRGFPCIAAAIDCRLQVRLTPVDGQNIVVTSSIGKASTSISELSFGPSFRYIEASFRLYADTLPSGAFLEVVSSINPLVGLASSASVTVAVLSALQRWMGVSVNKEELLQQSCQVIRSVQGFGSGADAASIIYGGVISYNAVTYDVERLASSLPLVLVYSGAKTPTPEVIRVVNEAEKRSPKYFGALFSAIAENTVAAIDAIKEARLADLGILMNQAQGLMQALGVSTSKMTSMWLELIEQQTIYGAKISGSGLGDCVVGLGHSTNKSLIPSKVAQDGLDV